MSYPLSVEKDGIKIKPEQMKPETIYHCIFQNKIIIVYKDHGKILNCYEIAVSYTHLTLPTNREV